MQNRPVPETWHEKRVHSMTHMAAVNEEVLARMQEAGYSEKDIFSMRLALEEAIVNAIRHGNHDDPTKGVHVRYRVTDQEVVTEIEDEGPGFNPEKVPDPLAPENLERPTGRGLFLIRYYMTSVAFNDRGNRITLCKQKSAAQ
jgi:serine/threonine-protein kinase RsbW